MVMNVIGRTITPLPLRPETEHEYFEREAREAGRRLAQRRREELLGRLNPRGRRRAA